ncbi:MAG: hypothetical protein ISS77_07865 [Phycisphaerae bacterium]|nr:hypothetical protein [Phycisphaerae bacterium]
MSLRSILIGGGGGNENYVVNNITNYYTSIDGNSIGYDDAGNMTADKDGYKYYYDYENRLVKVTKSSGPEVDVAEYAYDALGRRIRKIDSIGSETTLYYYNNNWQVVTEADSAGDTARYFVYGNFVDEAVMVRNVDSGEPEIDGVDLYYVQDHLYSTRALVDEGGVIVERAGFDVYGNANVRLIADIDGSGSVNTTDLFAFIDANGTSECDPNYNWSADIDNDGDVDSGDYSILLRFYGKSAESNQKSFFRNPYYFTGRRLDTLDNTGLKLQYNRNRYYNSEIGRWLTKDPIGYPDGMNPYEYVQSNPVMNVDPNGLWTFPSPYANIRSAFEGVCDKYRCFRKKCYREADLLARRYYSKLTAWISKRDVAHENGDGSEDRLGGGRYNYCSEYKAAIMGMDLNSGMKFFKLKRASDGVNFWGHEYVGLFHLCNHTDCSDVNLDPWTFMDRAHKPLVKGGTCGDIWW